LLNLSFVEGKFPTLFKQTSATPFTKGQSLDKSVPSNYSPIISKNLISKILERLFLSWFQPHIFNSYLSVCHCLPTRLLHWDGFADVSWRHRYYI